jgi:Tol biopolymer transport system component
MVPRTMLPGLLILVAAGLMGCGSGDGTPPGQGPEPPAPGPAATHTVGPLQVGTASTAGFKTLTLPSPQSQPVAFTVLYGATIVRLDEMGFGRIAFSSNADGDPELWTMDLDGANATRLTKNTLWDYGPAWSPDGTMIAFARRRPDGNTDIHCMNADGTGLRRLTNNAAADDSPAWSPDGTKIAFASTRTANRDIYVMNADGSAETRLSSQPGQEHHPAWSPDGRLIAYDLYSGDYDLCVMNADGSEQTNLLGTSDDELYPTWSPEGDRIAFARWASGGGDSRICTVKADGSGLTSLTGGGSGWLHYSPCWSPDGGHIIFQRSASSRQDLWVVNADGSDAHAVTTMKGMEEDPAWCPAPTVVHTLIGPAGSDGGSNPPFGVQKPLAIVGLTDEGLAGAATVGVGAAQWAGIKVAALEDLGSRLAGCKITAGRIIDVQEDMGRGSPPKVWDLTGPRNAGAVLVFFSAATGRVTSVIASSDTALNAADAIMAQQRGGQIVVRGDFLAVYSAHDPRTNLAARPVREVMLDAATGAVESLQ